MSRFGPIHNPIFEANSAKTISSVMDLTSVRMKTCVSTTNFRLQTLDYKLSTTLSTTNVLFKLYQVTFGFFILKVEPLT